MLKVSCDRMLGMLYKKFPWAIGIFCLMAAAGRAQTTYMDARFTVQVPAGWQAAKLPDQPDGVSITKGKAYVNMGIAPGQNSTDQSARDILAGYEKGVSGQCQGFQAIRRGDSTVAGVAGTYLLFSCSDARQGSVNLSAAIATSKGD